ncbi:receptor-type tyrosine-protein phosphatase eta-like [Protopterus annectens]|uniref:receptor-type tyrosine-protein phosphatase eta-like n=1 Tax=Protopterus annectens TaxID=7888 RepID=UPI001CFB83A3|nr:receptor-type tyrosine-protein phosphatase eta-like [Protopterus annectens]
MRLPVAALCFVVLFKVSSAVDGNQTIILSVLSRTTDSLTFSWNAVTNSSFFKVQLSGNITTEKNVTDLNLTFSGLTSGALYTVNVSAFSSDNATVVASAQLSSASRPKNVTKLTVVNTTTSSLFISWTAPVGYHSLYNVNISGSAYSGITVTTEYANMTGLTPGGNYSVTVSAVGLDNETVGDASDITVATRPEKVTELTIVNTTTSSVFISWTAPVGNHSLYVVNISGTVFSSMTVTTEYANMTGLTPGGNYSVTVSAVGLDNVTVGDASDITVATNCQHLQQNICFPDCTGPEKVTELSVVNTTTSSVFISWTAPVGNHSLYVVNINGTVYSSMRVITEYANMTGLTPGGNYSVTVSAVGLDNVTVGDASDITVATSK